MRRGTQMVEVRREHTMYKNLAVRALEVASWAALVLLVYSLRWEIYGMGVGR